MNLIDSGFPVCLRSALSVVGATVIGFGGLFIPLQVKAQEQAALPSQRGRIPAVLTDTEAVLLSETQLLVPAEVSRFVAQPEIGQFCLAVRSNPVMPEAPPIPLGSAAGVSLILCDTRTGRNFSLLSQDNRESDSETVRFQGAITAIRWEHNSYQAVVTTLVSPALIKEGDTPPPPTFNLYLVDAINHTIKSVYEGQQQPLVFEYPSLPSAIIRLTSTIPGNSIAPSWRFLSERGVLSEPLDVQSVVVQPQFDPTGKVAYLPVRSDNPDNNLSGKPLLSYQIDGANGKIINTAPVSAAQPADKKSAMSAELKLVRTDATISQGKETRVIHPLWLGNAKTNDQSVILVAPNAERSLLAKSNTSVLYVAEGSLYVRRLRRVPIAQFNAVQEATNRVQAMNDAYEIGQALQQYAQAHGNMLPSSGDLSSSLMQYMKDTSLLTDPQNGFNYTFAGGRTNSANDVVGYIRTGSGRAVIYGNGDVHWQP